MNGTIRRAVTVVGATVGVFALSTGTAMAHYCYRTDVPENSNMSKGAAWSTQEEMLAGFGDVPDLDAGCEAAIKVYIESLSGDTLFMGPGLLAAGAVRNGNAPDGIGHLAEVAMTLPACQAG